jgi:hypothetical protein
LALAALVEVHTHKTVRRETPLYLALLRLLVADAEVKRLDLLRVEMADLVVAVMDLHRAV